MRETSRPIGARRLEEAQSAVSLQAPSTLEQAAGLLAQDAQTALGSVAARLHRRIFAFARSKKPKQPEISRESANPFDDKGDTWDSFIGRGPHRQAPSTPQPLLPSDKDTIKKFKIKPEEKK